MFYFYNNKLFILNKSNTNNLLYMLLNIFYMKCFYKKIKNYLYISYKIFYVIYFLIF